MGRRTNRETAVRTRSRRRRPLAKTAALLGAAALLAAACGGDDSTDAETTPNADPTTAPSSPDDAGTGDDGESIELTTIRMGFIPIPGMEHLWNALEKGYFEEAGLNVELSPMAGGAAIIPAIEAGELDFGTTEPLAVINAIANGIPLRFVTLEHYEQPGQPVNALVSGSENVTEPADLVGESVAVNLRFNGAWAAVREFLRQNEVDPDAVEYVEVNFPDQAAALQSGTVAAAAMLEPFASFVAQEGGTVIGHHFAALHAALPVGGIMTSESFIAEHPKAVQAFYDVLSKSMAELRADTDRVQALTIENTEATEEILPLIPVSTFSPEANVDGLNVWLDLAKTEDLVDESMAVDDILWEGLPRS